MEREETVEEGEEIERESKGRLPRLGGKNKNGKAEENIIVELLLMAMERKV